MADDRGVPAGGDIGWGTVNDTGTNQDDGSQWASGFQGAGNDENMKPVSGDARNYNDNDNVCHTCGAPDHFARDCPNKEAGGSRACYNCGKEGHNKAECPEPQVLKGACRICNEEGHYAANCPTKPPPVCRNCKAEGHSTVDCTESRKFDSDDVPEMPADEAWAKMKQASDERDLDDFRQAFRIYSKAAPDATFVDIEKKMREDNFNIYTCALEKQAFDVLSLIDLQGQLDRQYVVGFYFSAKPNRKHLRDRWPATAEENLERLANAGLPYDRGVIKCRNCGEFGHAARACKQERVERFDTVEIKCGNCNAIGHRVRDCKEKRRSKYGCRNCGSEEHQAVDCPEPRNAVGVECRRCGETGHFAKDCTQGGDGGDARGSGACHNCGSTEHFARDCDQPRVMTCRNCDQPGHTARECPEPKDWSKVKCNQCGEMGHTIRRCRQAAGDNQPAGTGANSFTNDRFGGTGSDYGDASDTDFGGGNNQGWGGQTKSGNWGMTGPAADEHELSQKMAGVGFEAPGESQEPQYGW